MTSASNFCFRDLGAWLGGAATLIRATGTSWLGRLEELLAELQRANQCSWAGLSADQIARCSLDMVCSYPRAICGMELTEWACIYVGLVGGRGRRGKGVWVGCICSQYKALVRSCTVPAAAVPSLSVTISANVCSSSSEQIDSASEEVGATSVAAPATLSALRAQPGFSACH
eukprot:scaffold40887_cov44-Phaeocystis_antarctica.AAC.1